MLSGMAGGGGAFITAPYWLIIGLSPAQGAAVGSLLGLGLNTSSTAAFRNTEHFPTDKRLTAILASIAFIASIVGAFVLPHIDTGSFKILLAILTFAALPLLFIDRKWLRLHRHKQRWGIVIVALPLIAACIIPGSAFYVLVSIALSTVFTMSILQTMVIKRFIGIVQTSVLFVLLAAQGFFTVSYGIAALAGGIIGSYIGTKFAIRKGERFAKYALAAVGFVSATLLLL